MVRAKYIHEDDGRVVCLIESVRVPSVSLTNDAEHVIIDLVERGVDVDRRRIIYRDTDGQWDGLATSSGKFSGFVMLGRITDRDQAVTAALSRKQWEGCK